jgi:hypothetical protein
MTISKKLGLGVGLAALIAVACSSSYPSYYGPCVAACNHGMACAIAALIDAGFYVPDSDAGPFCQDACVPDGGGGYGMIYDGCKNPSAGYDCFAGLSCPDALNIDMGGYSPALQVCSAKAECPGVTTCTDPSTCPSATPCCEPGTNLVDGGLFLPGFCAPNRAAQVCLCTMVTQCSSGCCAPFVSTLGDPGNQRPGDPVGPYVCQDNNGFDYECCTHGQACLGTNFCCMTHQNGSDICVKQCTDDSQCGAAHCVNYVVPESGSTCVGNKACGP